MKNNPHLFEISGKKAWYLELTRDLYKPKVKLLNENIDSYSAANKDSIIINAGLFKLFSKKPAGQLIIDHIDYSLEDYIIHDNLYGEVSDSECYPLIVDNGNLYSLSSNKLDPIYARTNLVNYEGAVCGWGTLINDYLPTTLSTDEVIWGKAMVTRQIVGLLKNNDYFILTCECAYYDDIIKFLQDKKIKFAYSLDGGRSANLYVDGLPATDMPFRRSYIPTIIEFVKEKT